MGVAAGIGDVVSKSIKEEQKRVDLLTDRALDFHTKEYYRLKEKRSDKLERTESLIGELAARFGDDARAVERAAFYVNQNGIDGTRQLMKTFDDERARGNRLDAKDFFKYVNTDPDAPLKTKLEYAQGIVAPIQLGEPEFLTGVKSDRGIASLFTGDPKETLQRGFEERKAMGLYGKETERPDLQFNPEAGSGADMSLIRGKVLSPADRLNMAQDSLYSYELNNKDKLTGPNADPEAVKELTKLKSNVNMAQSAVIERSNFKQLMSIPDDAQSAFFQGSYLTSNFDPGTTEYERGKKLMDQASVFIDLRYGDTDKGTIGAGSIGAMWRAKDKEIKEKYVLMDKMGRKIYNANALGLKGEKDQTKLANAYNTVRQNEWSTFVTNARGDLTKGGTAMIGLISANEKLSLPKIEQEKLESDDGEDKQSLKDKKKIVKKIKTSGGKKIKLSKQNVSRVLTNAEASNLPENEIDDTILNLFEEQGHSKTEAKKILEEVKKDRKKIDPVSTKPTSYPLPTSSYDRSVERYNRTLKGKREMQKRAAEARRQGRRGLMSSPVT